jgi:eukaryotic-like serine/threonine-protein kinase
VHLNAKMSVGTPSDHRQGGRLSHSRMDDAVRCLGRFQIIGRLATGGMAEVYLALSGELPGYRTLLVVKRILPHLASNRQFIGMFLDEARLAALLDHPNVVRIIEVGHDGEEYFLAMELVQGKPLSAVLRKATRERRPPSPALAAYIIAQAASGLGYAHALTDGEGRPLGVVHRDVSPQNVLLSFEGAVKLIDFGVARAFGRVAHTSPGGLKGKIEYMSPEQASAEEVDHRADVFALGVVLWEVLTGRRLYRRETELATMRAILDDPIPRPSEVADVPPELDAVVMRALRKRRDARFASAHEMALALERFAFSNEGFSPLQVSSYMKGLFAAEFLQWRKTATAALDMEVDHGERRPRIETPGAEPPTQGPTMALRPGVSTSGVRGGSDVRSQTARSRGAISQAAPTLATLPSSPTSPTSPSSTSTVDAPSSKRDRLWVYGGLIVLVAITGYGAWMLTRSQGTTAPHDRPPALAMPTRMSAPRTPAVPPAASAPATFEPPPAPGRSSAVPGATAPAATAPTATAPGATAPAATAPAETPSASPMAGGASTGANPSPGAVPATGATPARAQPQQGKGAPRPHPKRRRARRDDGAATSPEEKARPSGAESAEKKADPFE